VGRIIPIIVSGFLLLFVANITANTAVDIAKVPTRIPSNIKGSFERTRDVSELLEILEKQIYS
jgi:hypothetical protein